MFLMELRVNCPLSEGPRGPTEHSTCFLADSLRIFMYLSTPLVHPTINPANDLTFPSSPPDQRLLKPHDWERSCDPRAQKSRLREVETRPMEESEQSGTTESKAQRRCTGGKRRETNVNCCHKQVKQRSKLPLHHMAHTF